MFSVQTNHEITEDCVMKKKMDCLGRGFLVLAGLCGAWVVSASDGDGADVSQRGVRAGAVGAGRDAAVARELRGEVLLRRIAQLKRHAAERDMGRA